jgi:ATP-binding cassette subfamily B protein
MSVTAACGTMIALLLGRLVSQLKWGSDQGLSRPELAELAGVYLAFLAATYLLRETLNVVRRYLAENTCTKVEKDMTVRLINHLMRVDLATLTTEKIGALHGRIQRSVVGFVRFLRIGLMEFLPAVLTGVFALAATVSKEPMLGLVMVGVIPISVYLTVRQLMTQKGVRLGIIHSREVMDGTVVELLHGLDYVRAANTHGFELDRVADAAEQRRRKEVRYHFEMSLYGCAKALNEAFFHILVLLVAVHFYLTGRVGEIGDILAFSLLFMNVMTPLAEIHRVLDDGYECSLQVGILLELLAQPTDRSFAMTKFREPHLRDGEPVLVVEDLHMDYPGEDGRPRRALAGVSLDVHHGETIGVAGRSGSGKTTWLRVLLRLTHATRGRVLLGGVPLEEVSRDAIGQLIGYVGQNPFVISGTVAENIAYGCPAATDEQIRHAARMACIHDEIMALPRGYQTCVAERGLNLSGGQRQRISLARVFLKNPPVLVLDEGTSALDNISERAVQKAIEAARADRTVILVAHRLTTLRDADRIIVFEGGKIVEEGTYRQLLRANGAFADLARHAEEGGEVVVSADEVAAVPA